MKKATENWTVTRYDGKYYWSPAYDRKSGVSFQMMRLKKNYPLITHSMENSDMIVQSEQTPIDLLFVL